MQTKKGGYNLRILRMDQVLERVGLGKSTIYERIKEGTFPRQIKLGQRAVGWLEHEVDAWLLSCIENSGFVEGRLFSHTIYEQDGKTILTRGEGRKAWES
ncbi:helix-turn-helix transcriptional regulator [Desulfogranum japonicum]|uniref:helix-turn-helix transcriptional regulator n=1 Tax=Desulfogranum japonicum TaxID=231447 RepID=UPI00040CD5B5|nr:AlpA family transcriptional regulator [Desulfogranum japonicum]